MPSKIKTLITSLVFALVSFTYAYAAEINTPGFTGSVNSTVTSGLSVRIDRNCLSEPGSEMAGNGSAAFQSAMTSRGDSAALQSALLNSDTPGCASRYTDGYGNAPDNTSGGTRSLLSANGDDGGMNFDGGDIFDSTSRVFTEISGSFDDGTNLNLSFVGSYNPITTFTNPTWAPFTSAALDEIETNIDVLDAYITTDIASMDAVLNAGQFVTNWGESTFIPIGMNGLTTNAIDLTKLRVPGSSIREALVPAQQITLSGYLDGGVSYEAYYQFGETHVQLDQAGTYFGNEVAMGDRLLFTSAFRKNNQSLSSACRILLAGPTGAGGANLGCNATTVATAASSNTSTSQYLIEAGVKGLVAGLTTEESNSLTTAQTLWTKAAAAGGAAAMSSAIDGANGDLETLALRGFGSTNAGLAGVSHAYANWDEYTRKLNRKAGALDAQGGNHIYADGNEQFGIALRTYLDNVGQGVDVGVYFSQYDSKTPYFRFKGQRGVHAGDLIGLFTLAATGAAGGGTGAGAFGLGSYFDEAAFVGDIDISSSLTLDVGASNTFAALGGALTDLAYGEAACAAYQNPKAVNKLYGGSAAATDSNFAWSEAQKTQALRFYNYTEIDGKLYHDSLKCYNNAQDDGSGEDFDTAGTQAAAAALLGAATTPLNMAEYEFIYPENLNAMGFSASTNVNGMTIQGEITYRPDFPLATNAGDQGQQLSDSSGATQLLSIGVAQGVQQACRDAYIADIGISSPSAADKTAAKAFISTAAQLAAIVGNSTYTTAGTKCGAKLQSVLQYRAGNSDADAEWGDVVGAIKSFNRSSLPRISLDDVAAGDYYTTPYLEYDVWSGTFGTTATFTASHPIVKGLNADGAVFLTEIGVVHVDGLDYARGGVNRGGYRDGVGGDKCGGVTKGGALGATNYNGTVRALNGATHLGSSQTDPLFGNSSYCESNNTIDSTSMTYRLIGSATYNNISNSAWSFSPSFVWSHDFSGYGPTSLGGFVPGRQSLSLSGNVSKGDVKVGVNYVNQLGDPMNNGSFDRDYVSANVSYAF